MTSIYWPNTRVLKSNQNAFTAHLTEPQSDIARKLQKAKTGPKPQTPSSSRFRDEPGKGAV